ncbi:hypothetical protein JB92DRAFT_3096935 [Gautieria morchelliformis]|nr:hypothetical protein JB92DRAFT_3096935 [Gautieria morchelliformis]
MRRPNKQIGKPQDPAVTPAACTFMDDSSIQDDLKVFDAAFEKSAFFNGSTATSPPPRQNDILIQAGFLWVLLRHCRTSRVARPPCLQDGLDATVTLHNIVKPSSSIKVNLKMLHVIDEQLCQIQDAYDAGDEYHRTFANNQASQTQAFELLCAQPLNIKALGVLGNCWSKRWSMVNGNGQCAQMRVLMQW